LFFLLGWGGVGGGGPVCERGARTAALLSHPDELILLSNSPIPRYHYLTHLCLPSVVATIVHNLKCALPLPRVDCDPFCPFSSQLRYISNGPQRRWCGLLSVHVAVGNSLSQQTFEWCGPTLFVLCIIGRFCSSCSVLGTDGRFFTSETAADWSIHPGAYCSNAPQNNRQYDVVDLAECQALCLQTAGCVMATLYKRYDYCYLHTSKCTQTYTSNSYYDSAEIEEGAGL
jgi:hypothetical protein